MTEQEKKVWSDYRENPSEYNIGQLVKQYTGLVHKVMYKHFSRFIRDHEDVFMSYGYEGLWRAIEKWEQTGDFLPFAYTCIFRTMYGHALQYANTHQSDLVKSGGQSKLGTIATYDSPLVSETKEVLDVLFEGRESYYDLLLEMYGHQTSTTQIHKQRKVKRKWSTVGSLKSTLYRIKQELHDKSQELGYNNR